jgi:vacuolar iron transporter family protein
MSKNKSYEKGFGFGLTSGIVTTLGMMVGMMVGTGSKAAVIGAILLIAFGDSLSDAFAMHIAEESTTTERGGGHVWKATISTLVFKILFAIIFIVPVLSMPLLTAVIVSIVLGAVLISIFSFYFALKQNARPIHVVFEHLLMMVVVLLLTFGIGKIVSFYFGNVA